jgi:hypothetical protein
MLASWQPVILVFLFQDLFGCLNTESLVREFSWAQWDPINQSLYYIHYRKPQLSVEGEEPEEGREEELSPTLSCLQFHDDMPHETVVWNKYLCAQI